MFYPGSPAAAGGAAATDCVTIDELPAVEEDNSASVWFLVLLVLFLIVIVLFSATTYDATSGVLASVSQYQLDEKGEAKPWLRLLWAGLLVMLPAGFIMSGSQLGPLQTITIIFALPVTVICIITVISFFKMVKQDVAEGKFVFPEKK